MIHPDDEQTLRTMLRQNDLPAALIDKYERWAFAIHRAGELGPLGAKVLAVLADSCDLVFPQPVIKPVKTIWTDLPVGTRVEAHFFGVWQLATFRGLAPNGAVAVQLDSGPTVLECYPHVVRLAGQSDQVAVAEAATDVEQGDVLGPPQAASTDWLAASQGDEVWAEEGGDVRDARFEKVGKASSERGIETVFVRFDDDQEPREVSASLVHMAT